MRDTLTGRPCLDIWKETPKRGREGVGLVRRFERNLYLLYVVEKGYLIPTDMYSVFYM